MQTPHAVLAASEPRRARRFVVWALLVVVALVPFVLIQGPGAGLLRDLGLVERRERFTELAFPDHLALPTTGSVGAPIQFDFSLRNREGRAITYRWRAVVSSPGHDEPLANGRIRLDDGARRSTHVAGAIAGPAGAAVVRVELVARDESIDFPLAVTPAVTPPDAAPGPA
jgi:hypothetical protein